MLESVRKIISDNLNVDRLEQTTFYDEYFDKIVTNILVSMINSDNSLKSVESILSQLSPEELTLFLSMFSDPIHTVHFLVRVDMIIKRLLEERK
jgi:hypothetical protein